MKCIALLAFGVDGITSFHQDLALDLKRNTKMKDISSALEAEMMTILDAESPFTHPDQLKRSLLGIGKSDAAAPWHPDGPLEDRSLEMLPGDPYGGQTMKEGTGGVHPNYYCDSDKEVHSWYEDQQFCLYRDSITYGVVPCHISDLSTPGVFTDCPETKEECLDMGIDGLSLESCSENCGNGVVLGGECSEETRCHLGSFCKRIPGESTGICSTCPSEPTDCLAEEDSFSKERCLECKLTCQ